MTVLALARPLQGATVVTTSVVDWTVVLRVLRGVLFPVRAVCVCVCVCDDPQDSWSYFSSSTVF